MRIARTTFAPFILLLATLLSCGIRADVPLFDIEIVASYPHDPAAFTQGLTIDKGELFEGTGRHGESSLRKVNLETGEILQRKNLGVRYFGEGITVLGNRIYQLTWQSHIGFVYDRDSFEQLQTFFLPGEGWGLTDDGEHLIVSDGTPIMRFLDPGKLNEVKRITVTEAGKPLDRLNELEYINGEIWANIWYSDQIVRIDPATGAVTSRVDLSSLNQQKRADDVLNGIAWDPESGRLFVTGKLWPMLYEIRVLE
jgi:glutaminyl-peptide cyclotransferase